MTKTDKSRIYSIIGAVLFTIWGLLIFCNTIGYILRFEDILDIVFECGVPVGFGVTLFLRDKKGVLVVSAVKAVLIFQGLFRIFNIYDVFYFAVYAGLFCVSELAIRRNNIVRKVWFIPMALLCALYLMICAAYDFDFMSLEYFAETAGVLFIGLWLREDVISPAAEKKMEVNNVYNIFNKNNVREDTRNHDSLIGGADRLKACKELLDSGVITQEEFEAKKKQILERY